MDTESVVGVLPVIEKGDNVERLASLFDVHYDRLYRLARRLARSADDALDLVQETFLRAAQCTKPLPNGFRDEEAWLVRVMINIQRDQWRRTSVRNRAAFGSTASQSHQRNPEAALIDRAAVWEALNAVSPRRRAILVMYELEGMEMAAIASLLGVSAITVRWHLSMGRRDLTRALGFQTGERK